MIKNYILSLILLSSCLQAFAQRHVDRFNVFNPLEKELAGKKQMQWLPGFYGTGGFGKYTGLKDTDHEWHHRMGVAFEILRWQERNSIAGITQASFIYDPNNSINFNPRAIFWEEGLLYTREYDRFNLQLTYFHRCKHDIDNLKTRKQRATINASFETRVLFNEWQTFIGQWRIAPGIDFYTTTYDNREPDQWQDKPLNWEQMIGAVNLHYLWRKSLNDDFNLFLSGYGKMTAFSKNEESFPARYSDLEQVRLNGAAFGGIEIQRNANLRIGVRIEHLADTGVPVKPRASTLLSLAVQGMSLGVFY